MMRPDAVRRRINVLDKTQSGNGMRPAAPTDGRIPL